MEFILDLHARRLMLDTVSGTQREEGKAKLPSEARLSTHHHGYECNGCKVLFPEYVKYYEVDTRYLLITSKVTRNITVKAEEESETLWQLK